MKFLGQVVVDIIDIKIHLLEVAQAYIGWYTGVDR